jgi:hypothetical protein
MLANGNFRYLIIFEETVCKSLVKAEPWFERLTKIVKNVYKR